MTTVHTWGKIAGGFLIAFASINVLLYLLVEYGSRVYGAQWSLCQKSCSGLCSKSPDTGKFVCH